MNTQHTDTITVVIAYDYHQITHQIKGNMGDVEEWMDEHLELTEDLQQILVVIGDEAYRMHLDATGWVWDELYGSW